VMMELNVTLDFRCCGCEQPVGVTVQCRGPLPRTPDLGGTEPGETEPEGIGAGADAPGQDPTPCATANVPCPGCGQINQLLFEPNGRLRSVRPMTCYRPLPAPSVN